MFTTDCITDVWQAQRHTLADYWTRLESLAFEEARQSIDDLKAVIVKGRERLCAADPDELFNDYFLFEVAVDALANYAAFWHDLYESRFAVSWTKLQDLQDNLRSLFRFARQDGILAFRLIEQQCGHIESLYLYGLFASVEMVYDRADCSICGRNIDDPQCPHLAGNLYRGQVAHGIVRDLRSLEGVALVENPMDKRCVLTFADDSHHFRLVAYMRSLLADGVLSPIRFKAVAKKTVILKAADLGGIGRNATCPCGSGVKFKKCCLPKGGVERPHFDIVAADAPLFTENDLVTLRSGVLPAEHPTNASNATPVPLRGTGEVQA